MSDPTTDDIKHHVKARDTWFRLGHMLVLALCLWLALGILWGTAIVQFLSMLLSGKPFASLAELGDVLGEYTRDVVRFLTYRSDEKPFPYTPLPRARDVSKDVE